MKFDIITIFPKIFDSYLNESIIKRALKKKLIQIKIHNLRDYTSNKHKTVDDRPYGGGPGMILLIGPIAKALLVVSRKQRNKKTKKQRIIMLTPAGKKFTQREAERLAKYDRIILLCGRYEGFDARVDKLVDEKISIGDYVLSGGELPAMVIAEAVARQLPGVVGHEHALNEETFSPPYVKASGGKQGLDYIEYPQYTRPEDFKGQKVPKVLLGGNHAEIRKWRQKNAKARK